MSIQPAAHIRENGQNDEIIDVGNLCPAAGKTQDSRLKTQDSRLKTQDSRLKTQDSRLKTQDYGDKNMVYPACPAGLVLRS
jgi:hypothetical protein